MRVTRVYVDAPLTPGERVTLEGSAASHVTRVLRLRVGDELTLFNGLGGEHAASIDKAHGGSVVVAVGKQQPLEVESPLGLTLAQGVSRGERMDLVVQKATELGVRLIVPLLSDRSVVRLTAQQKDRKLNHWRAIAIGACEQCGRNRLPDIAAPLAVADFLGGGAAAGTLRLLLSPTAPIAIRDLPHPADEVTALIGPEGGLTEGEQRAAIDAGFTAVRIGPRLLRTETAAIAALTLLQREFGDL